MRKKFNELNSSELNELLTEYHKHKVQTDYGWEIGFSVKWFYDNMYKVDAACTK